MKKEKFPDVVYIAFDADGNLFAFTDIKYIPIYYNDYEGIKIASYDLRDVSLVTREQKYKAVEND